MLFVVLCLVPVALSALCNQLVNNATVQTGETWSKVIVQCDVTIAAIEYPIGLDFISVNQSAESELTALVSAREDYPNRYTLDLTVELIVNATHRVHENFFVQFTFAHVNATRPSFNYDRWDEVSVWNRSEAVTFDFTLENVERVDTTNVVTDYLHVVSSEGVAAGFTGVTALEAFFAPNFGPSRVLRFTHDDLATATSLSDVQYAVVCVLALDPFWSPVCHYDTDPLGIWRFANTENKTYNGCACENFLFDDGPDPGGDDDHGHGWVLTLVLVPTICVAVMGFVVYRRKRRPVSSIQQSHEHYSILPNQ